MSQNEKVLTQLLLVSATVNAHVVRSEGVLDSPDLYTTRQIAIPIDMEDFETEEEFHKVMNLLMRASRQKVTRLQEEGKLDTLPKVKV